MPEALDLAMREACPLQGLVRRRPTRSDLAFSLAAGWGSSCCLLLELLDSDWDSSPRSLLSQEDVLLDLNLRVGVQGTESHAQHLGMITVALDDR